MKAFPILNPSDLYIEIGDSSLRALHGEDGLELSLERQENGRLTPLCAERLTSSLRVFLKKRNWRSPPRTFCALGARGLSLRQLNLPSGSKEEVERLLPLQIEREFPLAPEDLAWGFLSLGPQRNPHNGSPAALDFLVAAVKREVLQEYADILTGCGLTPVFTVAGLARNALCAQPPRDYAILDIGSRHSEIVLFENGLPTSLRVLPGSIEAGHLAKSLQSERIGQRLYLSGPSARLNELAPQLARTLNGNADCALLEIPLGEGRSSAILGLKKTCEQPGASMLLLQLGSNESGAVFPSSPWKWVALAGLLLLASVFLYYGESLLLKPRLARRIAEIKTYREKLPNIDRELSFLQYLKTNQPPYLETLFALANGAPAGTKIESLSMNGRGELSFRGSMRDSQQVADFRSRLIDSGLFSRVVVEEQTPAPDRQKLLVRISGQWRLAGDPPPHPAKPPSKTTEGPSTNRAAMPAHSEYGSAN